jgi:hypothetical protein
MTGPSVQRSYNAAAVGLAPGAVLEHVRKPAPDLNLSQRQMPSREHLRAAVDDTRAALKFVYRR